MDTSTGSSTDLNPVGVKAICVYVLLAVVAVLSGLAAVYPGVQVYAKDTSAVLLSALSKVLQ